MIDQVPVVLLDEHQLSDELVICLGAPLLPDYYNRTRRTEDSDNLTPVRESPLFLVSLAQPCASDPASRQPLAVP